MPDPILEGSNAVSPTVGLEGTVIPSTTSPNQDVNGQVGINPTPPAAPPATEDGTHSSAPSAQGSGGDSPTPVETEEDVFANADPELQAKPGFQNLRSSYQKRVQEVQTLNQRIQELEGGSSDTLIKIDAPADSWTVGEQLSEMQTNLAPYYNKMAWTIMEKHLPEVLPVFLENPTQLPAELRPLVEASATAILQSYTGMEPEQIGEAIRFYKQQMGLGATSSVGGFNPSQTPVQTPTQDLAQLANQHGLDPSNPQHASLLSSIATQQKELASLRASVEEVQKGNETRLVQTGQSRIGEQVEGFKTNLLAKVQFPQGYDHVRREVEDRVMSAFDRDTQVIAAKTDLEKFYKQGTPDLRAAASKLTTLQTRLAFHVKQIAEPRQAEVAELERLKTLTTQTQQTVKNPPPGSGSNPSPTPFNSSAKVTVDNAADLAVERWRASKLAKIPTA